MDFHINTQELTKLLKHFYTLTHIRIGVFDNAFQELAFYPNHHSEYCRLLRADPEANKKCALCDREACEMSRKQNKLISYRCHAGLTEAVTLIRCNDVAVGYLMLGQALQTDDRARSWEELAPYLTGFGVDINALKNAYFKKKRLSPEVITAASKLMEACSGYLYLSKMIVLNEDSLARRLDDYIQKNLPGDLSTETLCRALGVGKTRLYELSRRSYGRGIAEHIRALRIRRAQGLLSGEKEKIAEIAAQCGFPDYNYFTKVFKAYTGFTPRVYRKNFVQYKN